MDLSTLPTRLLLRWDLAVRIGLAVLVPLGIQFWRTGGVTGSVIAAALVAALVSLASVGPELAAPRWVAVAAIGTPLALVLGTVLGPSPTGGLLWVFVLYTAQGALTQVGLISQMAWYPIATVGLCGSVLATGATPVGEVAVAGFAGSAWAVLLMIGVARVIHAPRLPVPPGALAVDTASLRRMITHPTLAAWVFPLLLGSLAAGLLVVVDHLTGGFKPFWAVFALAGVLAPTAAATRKSTWETVGSTVAGLLLAALLLYSGLPAPTVLLTTVGMALVGAVLLLRNGLLSKVLMVPLPVLMAAAGLGEDGGLALGLRLVEYMLGAGLGFAAAVAGERLSTLLSQDRPAEQAELVG